MPEGRKEKPTLPANELQVPGSDERKIHRSISVGADCIVYDLEDSVSLNKKGTARHLVIDALEVRISQHFMQAKENSKRNPERLLLGLRTWQSREGCAYQCYRFW